MVVDLIHQVGADVDTVNGQVNCLPLTAQNPLFVTIHNTDQDVRMNVAGVTTYTLSVRPSIRI